MKVEVKALSDFVHCKYSFIKGQSEDLPLSVATDLKAAGLVSFQSMAEAVAAEAAAAEVGKSSRSSKVK